MVLATLVAAASVPTHAQNTVKIGAPLELSGRFVAYGAQGKRGIEMALDAHGDMAAGKKIEVLYRDVQSNNQVALTAFTDLVQQEKVNFVIGPIASGIVAASVPAWREGKPLWLVPGSSSTQLEDAMKGETLFFHTYPWAYNYHGNAAAAIAQAAGKGKKVVIIYSDGGYGREQLPWAKEFYTKAGFNVVATELVREGAADLNPVLQRLRQSRPDVLVGIVQTTDGIQLAKQIQVAGLKVPYLVGTAYPQLKEWADAVGPEAAGKWIGITTYLPGMTRPADPNLPKLFPAMSDWETAFRARYHREPEFLDVTSYTTAMLLLVAIDQAGTTDKNVVAAKLASLDIMTMLGSSKFHPTAGGAVHQAFSKMIVFQRQGDKFLTVYPDDVANGKLMPRQ